MQNAAFAAFGAQIADQDDMAARLIRLAQGSCYHGHSGLGSAFAAIADRKVRPGGVIALLILFTAVNGSSWAKFRRMIAENYADVTIVSIAANGPDMSLSSDTGVAECMVIGRKLAKGEKPDGRAKFVSLRRRPLGFAEAREIANFIIASDEFAPSGGWALWWHGYPLRRRGRVVWRSTGRPSGKPCGRLGIRSAAGRRSSPSRLRFDQRAFVVAGAAAGAGFAHRAAGSRWAARAGFAIDYQHRAPGAVHQRGRQPYGYLSGIVESQCRPGNLYGMRAGLVIASAARYGSAGCGIVGHGRPRPYQPGFSFYFPAAGRGIYGTGKPGWCGVAERNLCGQPV